MKFVLIFALVLVVILLRGTEVRAHGDRAITMPVTLNSGESFRIDMSFDIALLDDAEGGGAAVDHAWLRGLSTSELDALTERVRARVHEWFEISLGGEHLEGEIQFPDLDFPEPSFDNGEPEGHLIVIWSGHLPGRGGGFQVTLADEAPAAVIVTTVDGKMLRRSAVLLGGESKVLATIDPLPGGGTDDVMLQGAPHEPLTLEDETDADFAGGGGLSGARGFFAFGWKHAVFGGADHILLALALFFGAWKAGGLLIQPLAFLGGGLVGVFLPAIDFPPQFMLVGVAVLGIEALVAKAVRWWRLAVIFALGAGHAASSSTQFFEAAGAASAAAAFGLGIDFAHGMIIAGAFVVLGWALGAAYWRRWVAIPGSAAVAIAAGILVFWS